MGVVSEDKGVTAHAVIFKVVKDFTEEVDKALGLGNK